MSFLFQLLPDLNYVQATFIENKKQKSRPKYYELTHTELDGHRMSVLSFPCYMKAIQWPYYRGPARGGGEGSFYFTSL